MKWQQLCKLGRELPEVVEDVWFRTPALKVRGKSFVRLKEDGQSVVFLLESVDEQEFLTGAQPDVYYITDHYRGYPAILVRLEHIDVGELEELIVEAWHARARRR